MNHKAPLLETKVRLRDRDLQMPTAQNVQHPGSWVGREMRADQPKGSWQELSGILKEKVGGVRLSIDELNDAIAEASAQAGMRGVKRK